MSASNRDHPNAKRDGRATERDKDREVMRDPDIRGVRKGRRDPLERPVPDQPSGRRDRR